MVDDRGRPLWTWPAENGDLVLTVMGESGVLHGGHLWVMSVTLGEVRCSDCGVTLMGRAER